MDNESFKRLTKDEYSTMIEDQKTKKLDTIVKERNFPLPDFVKKAIGEE